MKHDYIRTGVKQSCHFVPFEMFLIFKFYSVFFYNIDNLIDFLPIIFFWNHAETSSMSPIYDETGIGKALTEIHKKKLLPLSESTVHCGCTRCL